MSRANNDAKGMMKEMTMSMRRTWKGMLAGLLAMVAVAGWSSSARASACGDLNNNGRVTIGDALLLLQAASGLPSGTFCGGAGALQCGDMNADGGITISDVVILLNFLAGNPTLFPICTGPGNNSTCTGPAGTGPSGETWTHSTTVQGNVTTNQIWPKGCRVNIDGLVFVQPGVTVTMKPGALVAGVDPPTTGSNTDALMYLRGSKINAAGTPTDPILMLSSDHLDHGAGHVGDWGGLTINGKAPVNCPGGECLAEGLTGVPFGGTDPHDSSGIVEYVRVEFSGKELTPDNELNVITINGVGRGTIWDHTQVNIGFDDGHEWFGGTVNGKFLVTTGVGDDLHDTQLGTVGRFQYYLGAYYEPTMQNLGNHGFEWDDNENGFDLLPRNTPIVCNATMIGSNLQPSVGLGQSERAADLRRGTSGRITNTIWEHFRSAGLKLDDNATAN